MGNAQEKKHTVTPEHVLRALTSLGFPDFVSEVNLTWQQFKEDAKGESGKRGDARPQGDRCRRARSI
jgi:hypothetical protein